MRIDVTYADMGLDLVGSYKSDDCKGKETILKQLMQHKAAEYNQQNGLYLIIWYDTIRWLLWCSCLVEAADSCHNLAQVADNCCLQPVDFGCWLVCFAAILRMQGR